MWRVRTGYRQQTAGTARLHSFLFFTHELLTGKESASKKTPIRSHYCTTMTGTPDPFWKSGEDARQYDELARTRFVRVYPVIADQVLERTGITRGACLEVGSGPALLAIALALLSDLRVTALDSSPAMYRLAEKQIRDRCIEDLVVPVIGDAHAIPAPDATFSLVVSRGSYQFWKDLPAVFREIFRVLRPGGAAYIGGGYGSARIQSEILADRKEHGAGGDRDMPVPFRKIRPEEIEHAVEAAGIADYQIIDDDSGFWVIIRKHGELNDDHSPERDTQTGQLKLPQFHDGFFFPGEP
jgi:SAM-dependent methyltransferase